MFDFQEVSNAKITKKRSDASTLLEFRFGRGCTSKHEPLTG